MIPGAASSKRTVAIIRKIPERVTTAEIDIQAILVSDLASLDAKTGSRVEEITPPRIRS